MRDCPRRAIRSRHWANGGSVLADVLNAGPTPNRGRIPTAHPRTDTFQTRGLSCKVARENGVAFSNELRNLSVARLDRMAIPHRVNRRNITALYFRWSCESARFRYRNFNQSVGGDFSQLLRICRSRPDPLRWRALSGT